MIDIPCNDIFRNDRLGLEPAVASRTQALLDHSPQSIAIVGNWGTGKSTFMALWAAYLRREGVKVVRFNAWKSFGADPLEALTKQILLQVEIPSSERGRPHQQLWALIERFAPLAAQGFKLASSLQPDLGEFSPAIEVGLESARGIAKTESTETEVPQIDSPDAFATLLSEAAKAWSDRPTVVMIDELDRCSPEYSVEMLQLLEHVFQAEHIVFAVAVNHTELVHSIKSFYGQGFNAESYLERFFNDFLAVPSSNRSQYIQSSLSPLQPFIPSSALHFLESSGLSLREIDKSIQHLRSVLSLHTGPPHQLIDLWIARTLAQAEYRQFVLGEISDKALVDAIFANGTCSSLRDERQQDYNYSSLQLEVTMITSSCVLPRGSVPSYRDGPEVKSELFRHYQRVIESGSTEGDVTVAYSREVVEDASANTDGLSMRRDPGNIGLAVRLLERESLP